MVYKRIVAYGKQELFIKTSIRRIFTPPGTDLTFGNAKLAGQNRDFRGSAIKLAKSHQGRLYLPFTKGEDTFIFLPFPFTKGGLRRF